MRILVWGTGNVSDENFFYLQKISLFKGVKIVCFIDNDAGKWGKFFHDIPIIKPDQVKEQEYDAVTIWVKDTKNEIKEQIINELHIADSKIIDIFAQYKKQLRENTKYADDLEAEEFLSILESKYWLDIYNYKRKTNNVLKEVFFDKESGLHYIFFEEKRMYLKRSYSNFIVKNDKKYVWNFWGEQDPNSPHLYESENIKVENGDILVDAGACEGNFSLHNINKVSKVYIIESDKEWVEALRHTFADYKDKVILCDKYLSINDGTDRICLDTVVKEAVNFIKMDIEGEETNALLGAERLFEQSDTLKCAICAYHRHNDEDKIKNIMQKHNMIIENSKGYMLFLGDKYVFENPELRRGIIRGVRLKRNEGK